MRNWIQAWIYQAYVRHCEGQHNADFEVCSNPRCWLAWQVEQRLLGWLYGEGADDEADQPDWHIIQLQSRLDRAEGEMKGMCRAIESWREEERLWHSFNEQLEEKLAAWDRWEHAWVFGGDAAYPGKAGVTDPREILNALERLALGVPEEEADDV